MYKLLTKISFIIIFSITLSNADILTKVDIKGNKRISSETIIVLGNIKINSNYSDDEINTVLKDLNGTNFFSDIDIDFNNGVLNINVQENPIIENIEISGVKNNDFKNELLENISLKNRMSFNEYLLQNDINLIQNIFKSSGFYFAEIKTKITKNNDLNSVQLIFDINQGDRARIKEISFIGNKKIKDKKLLEIIASEEHRFWKFVTNKVYLNQNTINLDKRLLENYYRNKGYYKVNVIDSFVEYEKEGFKLIYNIDAGNQYYFNNLKLDLPLDYDSSHFKELDKLFKKLKGKKYSLNDFNSILKKIDKIASSKLYEFIDSKVEHQIFDNNKIDITFNIIDSDKFYVERINILGNFQTIEEVIRNRLIVDEGDPLNTLLYNKSIDNIKSLRIFKDVKSQIKEGSNENLKIIDVTVEEKPTGEISLAAGVGTSGSTIGGGVVENNFLGKGIKLATNLEISKEAIKGKFDYTKPNFAYSENTLFTSFEATTTDYLDDYGYEVSSTAFSIGTEFQQYENFFFSPEISLSLEDLKTNSSASTQLKKQEGTYEDFYINYGINYDLRDSAYRSTSGNKTIFFQELPVISGNNELSNTLIFTQYKSFNETNDMVGKASLFLKNVNSLDNSDVRVSKRGQVPYNRLRGFEKGKVGPVDNSDYVGGNYVTALNLSTNLPGILSSVEILDFSYFVDIANVWGVDYDSSIDDSNKIRSSTGLGIDWLTPVGPLSFSFTKPITKKSTDKTESFRFNLGTTF